MRTPFLAIIPLLLAAPLSSQERATTTSGRAVLLYPDGTWKNAPAQSDSAVGAVNRPANATEKVIFARGKAALYFDPSQWNVTKAEEGTRTSLSHVSGEGYALIIAERIEFTMSALRDVALANAKKAAGDTELIRERHRQVNGQDVLEMELHGTLENIPFVYLGYYWVGKAGSFQIITFTAASMFEEYRSAFQDLLNGFVLLP